MTKFEFIIPTAWGNDVFENLKTLFASFCREWAFARHPIDELSGFEHWHIGGLCHSNRTPADILVAFSSVPEIKSNSLEKIKSHWKTYLCYIMHRTKDAIEKGKSAPVEFGGNADFEKALSDYETIGEMESLIDRIVNGDLREYDFYGNKALVAEVIKKGGLNKVKQAFESYGKNALTESSTRSEERKQAWIFGVAGSGKTELAKETCRNFGYRDVDIYITSSGSNPFDDYKGQPCIIVDDVDSETMTPKTMLKLADCFTGSAVKARYSNKVILADVVIFTSTVAPQTWWNRLSDEYTDGNVYQLLRRLTLGSWHIDGSSFNVTTYDGQGNISASAVAKLPPSVWEKVKFGRNQAVSAMKTLGGLFELEAVDISGVSMNMKMDISSGNFSGKVSVPDSKKAGASDV